MSVDIELTSAIDSPDRKLILEFALNFPNRLENSKIGIRINPVDFSATLLPEADKGERIIKPNEEFSVAVDDGKILLEFSMTGGKQILLSPRSMLAIPAIAGEPLDEEIRAKIPKATRRGNNGWRTVMHFLNRSGLPVKFSSGKLDLFRLMEIDNNNYLSGMELLEFAALSGNRLTLLNDIGDRYSLKDIANLIKLKNFDLLNNLLSANSPLKLSQIAYPLSEEFGVITRTELIDLTGGENSMPNRKNGLEKYLGLDNPDNWVLEEELERLKQTGKFKQGHYLKKTREGIHILSNFVMVIQRETKNPQTGKKVLPHSRSTLLNSANPVQGYDYDNWKVILEHPIIKNAEDYDMPTEMIVKVYRQS